MATSPPRKGIVAACDDPQLLNFPLWPKQRELLTAIEAGPRLHVLALGRRSGKTTMAALVALHDCLFRPHLAAYVRPGEKRYSVSVATSQKQASIFLDQARTIVEASPLLAKLVAEVRDDEIEFVNRTVIRALPATARGVRGLPVSSLLFDEAAHALDGDGNAAAEPMWRSLSPSLAQFREHGRAIVASTPFGSGGWFAELYERAAAGEIDGAAAHHATSAEINPELDADVLRTEFERDPEGYAGEYEAKFLASGGSFIAADRIAECVADRGELHRLDGDGWLAGLDPGFASDPFGLVILGRDSPNTGRLRLAVARSWRPTRGMTFEQRRAIEDGVLDEVAELCAAYDVTRAVTDQHLAPAIVSNLARRGVHVQTLPMTATTKDLIYAELRQRINDASLELYPHPDLLAELRRLRSRFQAGRSSVVNPRAGGSHGDIAQALAVATWAHRSAHAASLSGEFQWEDAPAYPLAGWDPGRGRF